MDQTFLYLLLFAGIIAIALVVLIKTGWLFGGGKIKTGAKGSLDRNFVLGKWQEIEELMVQQKPSAYKTAVLEADNLVDYVLKSKVGTTGTMGDRLKKARNLFVNYQDYQNLWEAHKTRNKVVHEADSEILFSDAKRAINNFGKALKELKVL